MSRKAMKKTLERLQKQAMESMKHYNEVLDETYGKNITQFVFVRIVGSANRALVSYYNYAKALEDAYSEYDETFEKLETIKLEKMKKAVESISVQKKDEGKRKKEKTKKTQYIR